jgi:quercetin dioxygenase-like cupin family protein
MIEASDPEIMQHLFNDISSAADYIPNSDHVGFATAKMLLDSPPSTNYKITYSVIEPGGFADEHLHPWDHAYYVIEGRARIKIGQEVRDLGKGSIAYVPPNWTHSVRNLLDTPLIILAVASPTSKYTTGKPVDRQQVEK